MGPHLDSGDSRAARLLGWLARLGCSPSEALALALLAAAALAGLALVWWAARPAAVDGAAAAPGAPAGGTATAVSPGPGVAASGGLAVRDRDVVVHVAGRVLHPGLYTLSEGARLADALEAAGGPLDDARLDYLNLARQLSDGEQVRVPGPDDVAAGPRQGDSGGPSAWRPDGTLDLNLAAASDLEELPGIGPVLAERVVAYRDRVGGFTSVGELRQVAGIGEKTFQRLAELVAV